VKQALFVFLLFLASLPLSSQTRQDGLVYVMDINGGTAGDRLFFANSLRIKIPAAGYALTDDILKADYALGCYLADSQEGEERLLVCSLLDAKAEKEIFSTVLRYQGVEDAYAMLPDFIGALFSALPLKPPETATATESAEITEETPASGGAAGETEETAPREDAGQPDAWKSWRLFLNARVGLSSRYYLAVSDAAPGASAITCEAGVEPELRLLDFLALQLGLDFSLDRAEYRRSPSNPVAIVYATSVLSVPFMVKYIFNPTPLTTLGPCLGLFVTVPLMGAARPPPFGLLGGLDLSVKTSLGIILFDLRASVDLGRTDATDGFVAYHRVFVTLSAGYQFGLLRR
jgi:hypothetical protein